MRQILCLGSLLCLAASTAMAQDPVKVAPNNYKVLFENDRVRVLEFQATPGEKTPMHSHPASVLYILSGDKVRFAQLGGKTEERELRAGSVIWSEAVTHTTENVGTTTNHVVRIELKEPAKTAKQPEEKK